MKAGLLRIVGYLVVILVPIFTAALLLLHPLLLAAGGAGWRLIIGLDVPWYIWLGKAALILLLANAALSHYQLPLKVKFETWRTVHDILGPVIIVSAFVHSWIVGDDLETAALKALWILMAALVVLVFAHHRFARPYRFKVIHVLSDPEEGWTGETGRVNPEKIQRFCGKDLSGKIFMELWREDYHTSEIDWGEPVGKAIVR